MDAGKFLQAEGAAILLSVGGGKVRRRGGAGEGGYGALGGALKADRGDLVGVPEGAQGWSRGRGQMGRVLRRAGPRWDGVRVVPAWPFPVPLRLPATPHGGFFPTLGILRAARSGQPGSWG